MNPPEAKNQRVVVRLNSWGEFLATLNTPSLHYSSRAPLYRGQRKASWLLDTTLERHGLKNYWERQYYNDACSAARVVESVTGKHWTIEEDTGQTSVYMPPSAYPFLAYLRQNGFPSPLIDWSRSPYVASFFAYHNAKPDAEDTHVAIFEFHDHPNGGKSSEGNEPVISSLGPWIATDKKHVLQQSEYTVCRKKVGEAGDIFNRCYTSHEEVFARGSTHQDVLIKYELPIAERTQVLAKLKQMNITAHSLFEDIGGLMDVLATDLLRVTNP